MTKEITKDKSISCPKCGSLNIKVTTTEYEFPYGRGDDTIELKTNVPLITCCDCGLSVLDKKAQTIIHEAICEHLRVMSPEQIKSLRGLYKLSQTQFCEVSKLGEATLSRWERGIVIQNNAYDNYLYLLGFRENMDRLQQRQGQNILPMLSTIDQINSSFREIEVTEDLIRKQEEFELQPYLNARG